MVSAYGTRTWTWGGDAACWSGPFSYLAAELVSVGRKLTEGRLIPYILQRALLCKHQQTVCPLPVVTVLLPLWTNTGFEWDAVRDKWTVAPLKKSFMSVLAPCPPLSFLVAPSLPHPPLPLSPSPLSISPAPSGSVRHNCVSWEIISSWPCSRSSDIFHLSSIFYPLPFFFYRPHPPFHCHLSSYPQNHFHLSSHTNILTEFLLVSVGGGGGG